jgi:hypothetical protein
MNETQFNSKPVYFTYAIFHAAKRVTSATHLIVDFRGAIDANR